MSVHHGVAETRRKLILEDLTEEIIGAAIEVHKELGPGLMESAYEECFCHELHLKHLKFQRQVPLPVQYKDIRLDCGYRLDVVVEDAVIIEIKCVEKVIPVHEAQLLTYLKMTQRRVGLIINFNVPRLVTGIVRKVL